MGINNKTYTINDVAKLLKCHRDTIIKLIECGDLDAIDIAPTGSRKRKFRITQNQLDAFTNRDGVYVPSER